MEFIIHFRQIVLGVIKPTGIVAGVGVVTNAVIKTIFRNTLDVLAAIGAVVLVVIDGIVYQVGIVTCFKNLHCATAIGKEAEIHHRAPFDDTIIDANHLDREFRVRLAFKIKFVCRGIKFIFYAGIKEVKESLIFCIPGAK